MGGQPFVVICDYEKMKDTFVKDGDAYSGKFHMPGAIEVYRGGLYGLVEAEGETWKTHRRYVIQQLREFGVGKNLMESKILLEVEALTKSLKGSAKAETNAQELFDVAVGSVINQFLFGYRFDDDKIEEFRELKTLVSAQMKTFSTPRAFFSVAHPWTKHTFIGKDIWGRMVQYRDAFYAFFYRQLDAHKKEVDFDSEESKDYVEAYLKEQAKRQKEGDKESFSDIQLVNVLLDLWFAGMETSANTLTWAIAYTLNNLETQDKLHEELDRVIGSDRDILMADKNDLVYVNAFINEVQRVANLLPMNLFHNLTRPVELEGYQLPADTGVLAQISTVLYDEKLFPEPYKFDPSRFIDEKGQLKKVDELIPFSIGKRQCLGEGLARMELFLFIANLFNRFKISPGKAGKPSLHKSFGITMQPIEFSCESPARTDTRSIAREHLTIIAVQKNGEAPYDKWTREYGQIYTFWLGHQPFVLINTLKKLNETFVQDGDSYLDKLVAHHFVKLFRGGPYGIIDAVGDNWREHRRFALTQMRDFGVGKNLMEEKILLSINDTFKTVDKNLGVEVTLKDYWIVIVGSVINQFLFGYGFDEERAHEIKYVQKLMDEQTKLFANVSSIIQMFLPEFCRHILGKYYVIDRMMVYRDKFFDIFKRQIKEHRETIDWDQEDNRDYMDAYLREQKKRVEAGDEESFCELQLINVCFDLFLAGLDTTTTTLTWGIVYALNHPEAMKKMQDELDQIVGRGNQVTMEHKSQLPYVNAFINETHRTGNIIALNVLHTLSRDVTIDGYDLKKGTGVVAQISTVMKDPKAFPEPHRFNPDRFIDENGKLKKIEELIPFSIGKRQCVGESLARMQIYLIIANFFNFYNVFPSKSGLPSMHRTEDFAARPRDFTCILEKRT
ncbi:unnamed protein product [Caenorhabditis auriculariae]|uniref:Unspecific monooxygenase n=1 Tax=Caenorhabditis auriculariae TaxID=2777116 RepID=A0A8S1HMF5_9PELO|nr:unnamed protein product [Caenorhabditis auriculariae]